MTERRMNRRRGDFRWPDQRGWALIGLFLLTFLILWWTAPPVGQEPSEFFKAIAQAVVLTGFLAAIGFLFNAAKSQEPGPPTNVNVVNPPSDPVITEEAGE